MSDDQEIISSGTPHEVHLAEGSNTAMHKTAVPMEPQVRNTMINPDEEVQVLEVVKGLSPHEEEETRMARAGAAADPASERTHHEAASSEMPDRMVSEDSAAATSHQGPALTQPLDQVMSDLPSLDLPASDAAADQFRASTIPEESSAAAPAAQEAATAADTSEALAEVAAPAQFMEEMNFPARVVKLKMANDQVRGQIEKLEKTLLPPIAVEAPAAPKGKEPAKKPAKGH